MDTKNTTATAFSDALAGLRATEKLIQDLDFLRHQIASEVGYSKDGWCSIDACLKCADGHLRAASALMFSACGDSTTHRHYLSPEAQSACRKDENF